MHISIYKIDISDEISSDKLTFERQTAPISANFFFFFLFTYLHTTIP